MWLVIVILCYLQYVGMLYTLHISYPGELEN